MRKFLFFVLIFFGIFSFGDELSLVQSFKFDGSVFYKKNTAKDESFYFLKNENFDEHFVGFRVKFDKNIKTVFKTVVCCVLVKILYNICKI